ncbi:MAG TPA: aminotransferase class IV [Caulobacteraceae bacterium]|jgi:branched-chain amino acid aminotransferase/4-amino-4-deoxychorismate lyase|nr:aminotransferase class IV [Caulobacteraceae bacterium]
MIAAEDRGFTLGDGLFETVLARRGTYRLWDAHITRLVQGCEVLGLPPPDPDACLEAAERKLVAAGLTAERAAVRLSWSAGIGGRGLDRPEAPAPQLTVAAAASRRPVTPVRLATASVRRNAGSPSSRLKSLSYLDNVLARREALAAGADEALMLNTRGELACGGAANLFWIDDGVLFTPALECGVLAGVMRGALIARATAAGLAVGEVCAGPQVLKAASAMFVTNSLIGVRAVADLDGRPFAPDPWVDRLADLVADLV